MRSMRSFFPAMIPACGPPRSLSPLNITIETPASTLCLTVGSLTPCSERSTRQPEPRSSTSQAAALAQRHELFKRRFFRKTCYLEIRRMHAQQHTRLLINRVFVIRKARAVGGADFSKDCPALLHNFRNPKAVPDFDQLSARDDYLAAAG